MAGLTNFVMSERALDGGVELLSIEGDTTGPSAARIRTRFDELASPEGIVIVDLSRVSFLDPSVVHALGDVAAAARKRGTRVVVVEPDDPTAANALELGDLDLVADVLPTLDQAAKAVRVPAASLRSPAADADDDSLAGQLARAREQLAEARRNAAAARGEADRMEAEAEDAHVLIQVLEKQLAAARAEADRMEAEAEAAHARIQALEREAEADLREAEPAPPDIRLEALEAENAELRAALEQTRSAAVVMAAEAETRAAAERDEHAQRQAEAAEARVRAAEEEHRRAAEAAQRDAEEARLRAEAEAAKVPRPLVPVWADPTPININTAGLEELMLLPGMGRRPAERIIAWREASGGFQTVDDLYAIKEIPKERIARIRPYIRV